MHGKIAFDNSNSKTRQVHTQSLAVQVLGIHPASTHLSNPKVPPKAFQTNKTAEASPPFVATRHLPPPTPTNLYGRDNWPPKDRPIFLHHLTPRHPPSTSTAPPTFLRHNKPFGITPYLAPHNHLTSPHLTHPYNPPNAAPHLPRKTPPPLQPPTSFPTISARARGLPIHYGEYSAAVTPVVRHSIHNGSIAGNKRLALNEPRHPFHLPSPNEGGSDRIDVGVGEGGAPRCMCRAGRQHLAQCRAHSALLRSVYRPTKPGARRGFACLQDASGG